MAPEINGAAVFHTASHIPIAQLTPLLSAPASRSIKAVVTLTWPYSSATRSVAFLLSEPDFRLRRTRGQVRVQFSGSSAKAVANSGIASGDQVILSLDGVEWVHDEVVKAPGRGVEFELKFTERLALQFQPEDSQDVKTIDIDHPEPEPEPQAEAPPRIPTPELANSPAVSSTHATPAPLDVTTKVGVEWSSPAFIKRARTSYGSLFESDYDPFAEEDGTVRGKGRKRTRLSSTWRYSSRSPTPEAEEDTAPVPTPPDSVTKSAPVMTDEACQTVDLDDGGTAETLADFARQSMNVGRDSYSSLNLSMVKTTASASQAVFPDSLGAMQPPQLLPSFGTQTIETDGLHHSEIIQDAPPSPHLQSLSSELLPEVSTRVPSRNFPLPEIVDQAKDTTNGRSLLEEPREAPSKPTSASDSEDDLYAASPARGRRGQEQFGAPRLDNLAPPVDGVDTSPLENQLASEDQYGHWQSTAAKLSHSASPDRDTGSLNGDAQPDQFYVEEADKEDQEQYADGRIPAPQPVVHSQQYPEIDDGPQAQQSSAWGPAIVPYPDLSGNITGIDTSSDIPAPLPNSAAMSRSHSRQSQVVDLTESSDEEEQDDQLEGSVQDDMEDEVGEGFLEGSFDEDEEGSLDDEEEAAFAEAIQNRNRQFAPSGSFQAEEDLDEEDDPEGYVDEDEDMLDADHQSFGLAPGEGGEDFFDEEEEGSYDEEEDGYMEPPVQRAPVVIDLLSSDDEDDAPPPGPAPPISASPRYPHGTKHNYENEESEEGTDAEEEDDSVPYGERSELKTQMEPRTMAKDPFIEQDDEVRIEDESDAEYEEEPARKTGLYAYEALAQDGVVEAEGLELEQRAKAQDAMIHIESAEEEAQHSKTLPEPIPTVDKSIKTAIPGQFGRPQTSPTKSSLFSRMFNLDGANDESEPGVQVSYPTLPTVRPSPPPSDQQAVSQASEAQLQERTNAQLPTPADTQQTGQIISTETSFTFVSDVALAPAELQFGSDARKNEFEQVGATDDASECTQMDVVDRTDGDMVVTTETEITIVEKDVEMSQEGNLETAEEPAVSGTGCLDEQIMKRETSPEVTKPENGETEQTEELVFQVEPKLEQDTPIVEDAAQEEPKTPMAEPEPIEDPNFMEETAVEDEPIQLDPIQDQLAREDLVGDQMMREDMISASELTETIELDPIQAQLAREDSVPENEKDLLTAKSNIFGHLTGFAKERESTTEVPRRSQRKAKTTTKAANTKENIKPVTSKNAPVAANTKENIRPVTPTEPETGHGLQVGLRRRAPPRTLLDSRAPVKGHDASVEISINDLASPSKQQQQQAPPTPSHNIRKVPIADLKLRLSRALRTELGEFTALKVLRYHLNQKLDVLAVATTTPAEPQRAKNGPRHYQITFNITDPSIAPSGVTEVQIFRPYKDALPTVQAGDGILLRNFQVTSVKNKGFGLRSVQDEGSSWAVFKDEEEAEVRGPPVEFGDGEKKHMMQMRTWYASLDATAVAKISRANGDKAGTGVGKSIAKAS